MRHYRMVVRLPKGGAREFAYREFDEKDDIEAKLLAVTLLQQGEEIHQLVRVGPRNDKKLI